MYTNCTTSKRKLLLPTYTMNKVFPIRTESACLLKWAWSTIYFNSGTSASCHRTQKYAIDPDNFGNFHNLPDKIAARELMLDGKWPTAGCQYCKNAEDSGAVSDRMFNLQQQNNGWLVPPELEVDSSATAVTPTILEVYFKNTCNMACVYCGPHYSSLWEEENRKFNQSFHDSQPYDIRRAQHNEHYNQMVADLWRYLDEKDRYKQIKRYHVLGGEPLLMSELDDSIEFWRTHPNPDLTFSIITNLNIPTARFERYIKQFERLVLGNKIWQLQLTASLDCWDSEQEYVRHGLKLELWQRNFELLLNKPWISLSINSAISALTIKSLPKLLARINEWNKQQLATSTWNDRARQAEPIIHSFSTPVELDNPYIFNGSVFAEDFEKILQLMPTDNEIQKGQKIVMQGIATQSLGMPGHPTEIKKLQEYLSVLDARRKTSWPSHFDWLNQDFSV